MIRLLLFSCLLLLGRVCCAQIDHGFPYGKVPLTDLQMKSYAKDSTANAIVLDEFGESWIDNDNDHNLQHTYHVKIKILNSKGFDQANIVVPLYKNGSKQELVTKIQASTFNLVNNRVEETKFDPKQVFKENKSKYLDLAKFTLPNIKEGSVIEVKYQLESPYIFNFKSWDFQSDIPKLRTEYWARIPGNYLYNITLRGFLKLQKQESELVKDCFMPGGGQKADCGLYKYAMLDVPAFVEEDYMTAKVNFVASINFELSELQYFDGRKDKITKEWKDIDQELRNSPSFGGQLRKGKDIFKDNLTQLVSAETDSLKKAQQIFDFIKNWYTWNDYFDKYSDLGIKKAFDSKTGNVGDINLSLVAALNHAGFVAEPVILSTRDNGLPIEVHPVMSNFNYVIGKVKIKGITYLLDATDPFLTFGTLPIRCLNGKGRVIATKGSSYWLDINPTAKIKSVSVMELKLQPTGNFTGKVSNQSHGYDALQERKRISSYNTQDEYIEALDDKWNKIKILKYEINNLDKPDLALLQQYEVQIEGFDNIDKNKLFLNPFFIDEWGKNPFTAKERLYPVDLGAPLESQLILNLEYPGDFQMETPPAPLIVSLPNNGGRYMFSVQNVGNKVILNSIITLNKAIYSSQEYAYLKELFNKIVQSYQTNLVFTKKS